MKKKEKRKTSEISALKNLTESHCTALYSFKGQFCLAHLQKNIIVSNITVIYTFFSKNGIYITPKRMNIYLSGYKVALDKKENDHCYSIVSF